MPFGMPRPLRPGEQPRPADFNAMAEAIAQMGESSNTYGSDLSVDRSNGGIQVNDHATPGHWAKVTGVAAGLHAHVEVTPDGVALASGEGYYGAATANGTPAREVNGQTAPTGTVVWLELDPFRNGWVFSLAASSAATAPGGFYARITGNAGKRYSFVQVAVRAENPPGTVTDDVIDAPGGVTGTTSVGWAYDIGGGSVALHTPAPPLVVLMTPNPIAAGTWLFGPISVCP